MYWLPRENGMVPRSPRAPPPTPSAGIYPLFLAIGPEGGVGLPKSYAMASTGAAKLPRDFRPGLGARAAVAHATWAAKSVEEAMAEAAYLELDDDISGFEGRMKGHLDLHAKLRKRDKETGARTTAHPPVPVSHA